MKHTRPTAAKVREAIFNILGRKTKGAVFLDLFAGTGAVGIDAYLYGAEKVVLVEKIRGQVSTLDKNFVKCGDLTPIRSDAIKFLKKCDMKFDIIFIDPPYESDLGERALEVIAERELLNKDGIIIFEHYHKKEFKVDLDKFAITDRRKYGQTALTFISVKR